MNRIHQVVSRTRTVTTTLTLALVTAASAASFFGFNPENYNGKELSAATLKQMVAAATKNMPPRNGKNYVIGFANLTRDVSFTIKVEDSIKRNADAAGVSLVVGDNQLSGPKALAVADTFLQRNVDVVIEFETDANFGQQIKTKLDAAKIPVIAIDIPMSDAVFFGANNVYSGYLAGAYLGQAAMAKWGAAKANQAYLVVGELPQSGVVPKMRTDGQVGGVQAVLKSLPAQNVVKFDSKNTLEESFKQMSNVLGRIPRGAPILATAINDQATKGMLQAVKAAGRESDFIAVGLGADELDTLVKEPAFLASVAYFPERYGNYLIPMALMQLAGQQVPQGVLVQHQVVTPNNICKYYPAYKCFTKPLNVAFRFPAAEYKAFVDQMRKEPELKDFQSLLKN